MQYSTLLDALAAVPDPCKARGKQLEGSFILAVIASALVSQQQSIAAIAQWAHHHAATLVATFQPARGRVPSEATLRRALRQIDVTALEAPLMRFTPWSLPTTPATAPSAFQGYAWEIRPWGWGPWRSNVARQLGAT